MDDGLDDDLKKIEELQNELNKIKKEEEDLLTEAFDKEIKLLEIEYQNEIDSLEKEKEKLEGNNIINLNNFQKNEINNNNFIKIIEQNIIKEINKQLNDYFNKNKNLENKIYQIKKEINDEFNHKIENQIKEIISAVKISNEKMQEIYLGKFERINESIKKINEELFSQEEFKPKNIDKKKITGKSKEKQNHSQNDEISIIQNINIYNKKLIDREKKNNKIEKKKSNNNINSSIFRDLIKEEDNKNQKIYENDDQEMRENCSQNNHGFKEQLINKVNDPNNAINSFLNSKKNYQNQDLNYNNLENNEKFSFNSKKNNNPKKVLIQQKNKIPKALKQAKTKNYLTILKTTFFSDHQQRYIKNKKMNEFDREELIREIIENRKQNEKDVEYNIKLFIEKRIIPKIQKKTLSNDELKTVKYNISLILECLGLDRNYYDNLYEYKAKTITIDREKSIDAVKKFRKQYEIGKDIITDEELESKIIKNDFKFENFSQEIYD